MPANFTAYRKGFLVVAVTGCGGERFFNLCASGGLDVWDLRPADEGFCCCMSLASFRRIRPLAKKAGVRIRIMSRKGLPFFIYRNRMREGMLLGILAAGILIYTLSLFVWNITFEGNFHYSQDTLLSYLDTLDIRCGIRKDGISCEDLEESIRSAFPEITWVSASVSGTRLIVRVKENEVLSSVPETDDSPCRITASQPGSITRMVVRQGKAVVSVGDTVEEGQLLVTPELSVMNDAGEVVRTKYVHADADIYARTRNVYTTEEPLMRTEYVASGRKSYGFAVTAGGFRAAFHLPSFTGICRDLQDTLRSLLNLSGNTEADGTRGEESVPAALSENGRTWRYTSQSSQLKLFGDFYLPVYLEKTVGEEFWYYDRKSTDEEMNERAEYRKNQYIENLSEKGVHIIENNVKIQENGLSYTVTVEITAETQIAGREPVEVKNEEMTEKE